ncbi:Mitochondrial inner membrane protease subunit 2 [Halotydeus destructor]|nr:Mitochondrial inner membrane protease subunit 2 [Halotydeus destructor]
MQPSLNPGHKWNARSNPDNDIILVNKLLSRQYKYVRGDIVVMRSPRNPKERIVKRIVAMEGDRILPYKSSGIVDVPKGSVWIEGDNHDSSHDSTDYGPVPLGLVMGRASHIIFPFHRYQTIEPKLPRNAKMRLRRSKYNPDTNDEFNDST